MLAFEILICCCIHTEISHVEGLNARETHEIAELQKRLKGSLQLQVWFSWELEAIPDIIEEVVVARQSNKHFMTEIKMQLCNLSLYTYMYYIFLRQNIDYHELCISPILNDVELHVIEFLHGYTFVFICYRD